MTRSRPLWIPSLRSSTIAAVAVAALIGPLVTPTSAWAAQRPPAPATAESVPGLSASPLADYPIPATSSSVASPLPTGLTAGTFTIQLNAESAAPSTPDPNSTPTPNASGTPSVPSAAPRDATPTPTPTSTSAPTAPLATQSTDSLAVDDTSIDPLWQEVGSTGIEVAASAGANPGLNARGQDAPATSVTVTVLTDKERRALGVTGIGLRIQRADGGTSAAPIDVRIPSDLIEGLYGANYASRIHWVSIASSSKSKPADLEAVTDSTSGSTLLTPAVGSTSMVIASTASVTSSTGTGSFAATDLKPSSSWDVSAQTGGFAWTYPMVAPPAPAGPAPDVNLVYSSQSVDGETGSTNNQPSAVGEGWTLGGSGFIERTYVSCSRDDGASGPVTTSGDLCWKTDNATLSFAGHSGPIVRDSTTGVWKLESDDGSRIERLLGTAQGCASNGTYNTECWRLTTTDGTQYYFGLNQLPGWSAGKATTNSAWTVPVFGNDSGEPCNTGTFATSSCQQGWRWNLDYVVDVHGNAEALYYHAETNKYAAGGTGATTYTRGGSIDRIEYGLKAASIYTTNAATGKVVFGYDSYGRCNDPIRTNCTTQALDGLTTTPTTPATSWPTASWPSSPPR